MQEYQYQLSSIIWTMCIINKGNCWQPIINHVISLLLTANSKEVPSKKSDPTQSAITLLNSSNLVQHALSNLQSSRIGLDITHPMSCILIKNQNDSGSRNKLISNDPELVPWLTLSLNKYETRMNLTANQSTYTPENRIWQHSCIWSFKGLIYNDVFEKQTD